MVKVCILVTGDVCLGSVIPGEGWGAKLRVCHLAGVLTPAEHAVFYTEMDIVGEIMMRLFKHHRFLGHLVKVCQLLPFFK